MRKLNAESFVEEKLEPNDELREEQLMAEACCGHEVSLEATRLTFFCSSTESKRWDDEDALPEDHLLGYAVVVNLESLSDQRFPKTYMLEAVVRPPSVVLHLEGNEIFIRPVTNYYVHNVAEFETVLGRPPTARRLNLTGSFFTQQNGLTSICAHAALRMAINSSPLLQTQKLTNRYINDLLQINDHNPGKGLTREQIEHVVSGLGFLVHSANFLQNTSIEYDHFMYPSLESCLPTILGIEKWDDRSHKVSGHVVTVLGHTTNSDRWAPEARRGYGNYPVLPYIPSAEWCCHYVISDDNYGMYGTLPSDAIRNFLVPSKNPNQHVSMAISILPREVSIRGNSAEQLAIEKTHQLVGKVELETSNIWLARLRTQRLVCRTHLQKRGQYISFIQEHVPELTEEQHVVLSSLPEYVWVSELSLPNIFTGNKHKLGDVVIRANATPEEHSNGKSLAMAWFPGFVQLGATRNIQRWSIQTHIPLIRNTQSPLLEW